MVIIIVYVKSGNKLINALAKAFPINLVQSTFMWIGIKNLIKHQQWDTQLLLSKN